MSEWKHTGRSRFKRKWLFWRVWEDEVRRCEVDDTGLRLGFHEDKPKVFYITRWVRSHTAPETRLNAGQGLALNRCWVVRGAEAHRAFVDEDEARAFAGDWGKVISMVEES